MGKPAQEWHTDLTTKGLSLSEGRVEACQVCQWNAGCSTLTERIVMLESDTPVIWRTHLWTGRQRGPQTGTRTARLRRLRVHHPMTS